jgi:hypothetical protein
MDGKFSMSKFEGNEIIMTITASYTQSKVHGPRHQIQINSSKNDYKKNDKQRIRTVDEEIESESEELKLNREGIDALKRGEVQRHDGCHALNTRLFLDRLDSFGALLDRAARCWGVKYAYVEIT